MVEASFFAMRMRRLLEILQGCLRVCFDIISVFATADKNLQIANPSFCQPDLDASLTTESEPNWRYCWNLKGIERCLISHFLNPKTCSGSYLVS
jgi:hypothetical protein